MMGTLQQPTPIAPQRAKAEAATGYLHRQYAQSLSEFGKPRLLPSSGGWVLERPVRETAYRDAIGCYPLLCCRDWTQLGADLDELDSELVSMAAVIDPYADVTQGQLGECFDIVRQYKEHWCVDLGALEGPIGNKHHRYYARKALQDVKVEMHTQPLNFLSEWSDMYAHLVRRHHIAGIQAFSRRAFELQMSVPGLLMFRATQNGDAVACHLWFVQGKVAYSHLAASTDLGYAANASYALYDAAISAFRDGVAGPVRWVQLGAGAGIAAQDDGLTQFKKGWANCSRPAFFCGRVLNREAYVTLSAAADERGEFFPAYRQDEMK